MNELSILDLRIIADLSRCDIGTHVSEEVLVEGLPDLHEVIGDGPLWVPHRVVEVGMGDRASSGVIGLIKVILQVPFTRGWLQYQMIFKLTLMTKGRLTDLGVLSCSTTVQLSGILKFFQPKRPASSFLSAPMAQVTSTSRECNQTL